MDTRHALIVSEYKRLRESLLASFPELAEDEDTLADTLEGESDLPDIIARLIRAHREDKAMADALGVMIAETSERRTRLSSRAEKRKAFALDLMNAAGLRKIELPDFTASVRNVSPKVEVIDDTLLTDAFLKVVKSPDKSAIKAALEQGETVEGAMLGNGGQSLSVRTK